MNFKTKRILTEVIILLILLAPLAYAATVWNKLPDPMPTHFNAEGKPDGFTAQPWGTVLLPIVNMGLYLLFLALPYLDPRRENYKLFLDKLLIIRLLMHVFMSGIAIVTMLYAMGYPVEIDTVIKFAVPVLLLVLGNYFMTLRPNWFIGFRTPWTLSSDTNWRRTHRFGGWVWVLGSLALIVAILVVPVPMAVYSAWLGIVALSPVVYSFIVFRQERGKHST